MIYKDLILPERELLKSLEIAIGNLVIHFTSNDSRCFWRAEVLSSGKRQLELGSYCENERIILFRINSRRLLSMSNEEILKQIEFTLNEKVYLNFN